ncbi:MAG: NAD-dependent epimerase/dehydratase family protein [Chloroflexi bacterium]|nr:NAD-dependent epimerase/dehydratase family protein [Chloroflexota bacterium]
MVHLAAHAKVHELVQQPDRALENITMTWNVLEYCRQHQIPIIFSSPRSVRRHPPLHHRRILRRLRPHRSPYSASKISGEALIYAYAQCYGLHYLVFRFSNALQPL